MDRIPCRLSYFSSQMSSRLGFSASRFRVLSLQFRRPQAPLVRSLSAVAECAAPPTLAPWRSHFRRAAAFTGSALLLTCIGFSIVTFPEYKSIAAILSPPSDADTRSLFAPPDDDAQAKEDLINSHPLTASLRENPDMLESRPHLKIPPSWKKRNLTGGTLSGPGRVVVPPFSWSEKGGKSYVQISHVGTDLCGHMGIIHGGFLATMLDEGLARCCLPIMPLNIAVTAKLAVSYKAPAIADQYLVLRATTVRVEGRKAWVEGHIETLPTEEGQQPIVLATATALYVSPKQASALAKAFPVV